MVNRFCILLSVIFTIYFGNFLSMKHINDATYEELDSILGVGKAKAESILQKKPYASLEDFKEKNKGKVGELVVSRIVKKFRF